MKKVFLLIAILILGCAAGAAVAQTQATGLTPAIHIVDITNIIYPLPLPPGGGPITFTYKITNVGDVPLNNVTVTDNSCSDMSSELGDTNGNHFLDPNEVWIYTCATLLTRTTTHTVIVVAYANGAKAVDTATATVDVPGTTSTATTSSPTLPNSGSNPNLIPSFPNNGINPGTLNITLLIWIILGGILAALIVVYLVVTRKKQ